jgi:hypothetical protein
MKYRIPMENDTGVVLLQLEIALHLGRGCSIGENHQVDSTSSNARMQIATCTWNAACYWDNA